MKTPAVSACWIVALLLCPLFFFNSCERLKQADEARKIVREWKGKKIVFPGSMPARVQGRDTLCNDFFDRPYKIVVYIDSTGCTDCKLRFYEWSRLIEETRSLHLSVSFIFIAHVKDYAELEILAKRDRFTGPVWYDLHNEFSPGNRLPEDPRYQTLLLDKNNRVVLIGRPQKNPKLWKIYKKEIASASCLTVAELSAPEIDLGRFPYSSVQHRQVTIKNAGAVPLVIRKAETGCGCTSVLFPQEPIAPQKTGNLHIAYEPNGLGRFSKKIILYCNTPGEQVGLQIKGEVAEDEP